MSQPKDDTLNLIGVGLAVVGFITLLFGDWSSGVQYIGGGFVLLAALVSALDRIITAYERKGER